MYKNKNNMVTIMMSILLLINIVFPLINVKAISVVTSITSVNPVISVKVVPSTCDSINISWSPVSEAKGYGVYRATSLKGPYILITAPTQSSYTNTGLTNNITYFYSIRAYIIDGKTKVNSAYSAKASASPVPFSTFFNNDVFVGDSITYRMGSYGYMAPSKLIAKGGATIVDIKNLLIASKVKSPKRVIIMCGVNNLGFDRLNVTNFKNLYNDLIVTAKKKYPKSKIIVEPIFKVNATCSRVKNIEVAKCNTIIKGLATSNRITFLDTSSINVSSSSIRMADGLHFKPKFYSIWLAFIAKRA
ncbi:MAG TPA: GDSL-type esterase/lipase family protein [Clostridium sp.]|uniref:SGNH/GDSL hydrolase family protein n=1 Tax=Clostridium sp. TaxID=1506 RepID=UPI002F922D78